jgi:hypothetical protein
MPRYLIERELPGAGKLTAEELHDLAVTSNDVLATMAGRAQWVESYVTDNAITCVYIGEIGTVIDPTT